MATVPNSRGRDFENLQFDLEDVVSRLKKTLEPKSRASLLREFRLLLEEAERIIASDVPAIAKILHFDGHKKL